jgi:hypothetical protein
MEKKLYISPMMKVHIMKGYRLMVKISNEDIDPEIFEPSAKEGLFDENDNILPRGRNVWADDF